MLGNRSHHHFPAPLKENSMSRPVTIIKVDPEKRIIVRMSVKPSIAGVRKLIGCNNIGHRILLHDAKGEMLLVGARVDQDREKPKKEWRIRGGDNTVGTGILFGTLDRKLDGMWHVPVDVEWVKKHVVWADPGEDAPAAEVAVAQGLPVPECNTSCQAAVLTGVACADGECDRQNGVLSDVLAAREIGEIPEYRHPEPLPEPESSPLLN
jgi:hypothetical protein